LNTTPAQALAVTVGAPVTHPLAVQVTPVTDVPGFAPGHDRVEVAPVIAQGVR